jgi:hypothetical protein
MLQDFLASPKHKKKAGARNARASFFSLQKQSSILLQQ